MNYKELKGRIRDLGFEDDAAIEENINVVLSGINTAINTIACTVMPITEDYIIEQEGTIKGMTRYNFKELVDGFLGFYKKPRIEIEEELIIFNDYHIENNKTLVIKGSFSGRLMCGYKRMPAVITDKTGDDVEIELEPIVHELVPLLAAYHIWLDDENTKATQYQNLYEDRKNEIMASNIEPTHIKITGGVKWRS